MAEAARTLEAQTESAARGGSLEDIELIEEYTDSGLAQILESYVSAYRFEDMPVDTIPDRFTVDLSQPLPQFDTGGAKAYAARCLFSTNKEVYALVCDSHVPYRLNAIEKLTGMVSSSIIVPYDAQPMRLSQLNAVRMVMFLDRPKGQTLRQILDSGKRFTEREMIHTILKPIADALISIHEHGIRHGCINPSKIYIGDKVVLGECVSEPQGLSQEYLYEPIERALADPISKGMATAKTDAYALAMLAYEMMYGLDRFRELDKPAFLKQIIDVGSYHLYSANKEVSEDLADFFRGTHNENKEERWGLEQIRSWLDGKRYNLIHPSLPKEASRPFVFNDTEYFNCRALAHAIHRNWAQAGKEMRNAKLDRWLEMSAHKPETSDKVERIIRMTGGDKASNPRMNSELNARLIIALDPTGPIRMERTSVNVDGLGHSIAHYSQNNKQQEIAQIFDMVEFDLPSYWADMTDMEKTTTTNETIWKLQSARLYLKQKAFGFGIERVVYDLNPNLPCQSDLLVGYHVITVEDILRVLDSMAAKHAKDTSFIDRHLAAFLASKLGISKEIKFAQFNKMPNLRENPELQVLKILCTAQEKTGKPKLVGLSTWVAMRVESISEGIYNRKTRKKLKQKLKEAANTGYASYVLALLTESETARDDYMGFAKANALYLRNSTRVDALSNPKTVDKMSNDLGGRISVFVAYLVLAITVYILIDQYYIGFFR